MKFTKKLFTALLALVMVLSSFAAMPLTADASWQSRRVMYVSKLHTDSYSKYNSYSQVIVSFAKAKKYDNNNYLFTFSGSGKGVTMERVKQLRDKGGVGKVLLAIGGSDDKVIADAIEYAYNKYTAGNSNPINNLTDSISNLVSEYGFDGVDLDWEYFSDYSKYNPMYKFFARKVRSALGSSKTITLAGQLSKSFYANSDIKDMMSSYINYVNIMSYETAGKSTTKIKSTADYATIKAAVDGYASATGSRSKLNLGIPFYGIAFDNSSIRNYGASATITKDGDGDVRTFSYSDIMSRMNEAGVSYSKVKYFDKDGNGKYWTATVAISGRQYLFDDATTVANKVAWAKAYGLGGVMAWQGEHDNSSYTLTKAMRGW